MTKFWLSKGVSGLCLETSAVYMEDPQFRNEQVAHWMHNVSYLELPDSYHPYTYNLDDSLICIHELREFIDYHFDTKHK